MKTKKTLNREALTQVISCSGTYHGEKECPKCHKPTMQYMPSILMPDGVSYIVYRCSDPTCAHEEYIAD